MIPSVVVLSDSLFERYGKLPSRRGIGALPSIWWVVLVNFNVVVVSVVARAVVVVVVVVGISEEEVQLGKILQVFENKFTLWFCV